MTVADLIRELQRLPIQTASVRVVPGTIFYRDESGEAMINCCDEDATEADEVRHMGPWVLIRGR
jgi:hypothetical protein